MAFGKTVLVAGMLAASANAAFADNRQHHPHQAPTQNYITAEAGPNGEFPPSSAFSKDGKPLTVQIAVPSKNTGDYKPDQFHRALSGGVMMAAIKVFSQFNEADIVKNMDKIQKMITEEVGKTVPMGTVNKDGTPGMAQPGVNYGNATVLSVKEAVSGNKVLFEQKAPATQPAPKPGAPKA